MTARHPRFSRHVRVFALGSVVASLAFLGSGCSTGAQGPGDEAIEAPPPHVAPGVARSAEGPAQHPTPSPTQSPAPSATQQTPAPTATAAPTTTPPPTATQSPPSTAAPPVQVELAVETADGGHFVPIMVELATTSAERAVGLSNRHYLPPDDGMLFIFPSTTNSAFWMKDTYIPLDIAYLAADGTIQEIHLGEPLSTDLIHPSQPYRYTLEMNGGWFAANGFAIGDRVLLTTLFPAAE